MPYAKRAWFKEDRWANRVAEVTEVQHEFIEWLLDPSRQGSQREWAESHGIRVTTVGHWKKQRFFRDAWDKRALELNGGPERVQNIIQAMYNKAMDGDVPAMKAYLAHVGRTTPKESSETKELSKMTDAELADQLEAEAQRTAQITHLRSVKGAASGS